MSASHSETTPHPSLFRRVAAMLYDALLLTPVLMLVTLGVIAFQDGNAIEPGTWWYRLLLLLVSASFFVVFWRRGGQTLGMKAWRLQVTDLQGTKPGVGQCYLRFFLAVASALALGLGFLWALVDQKKRTWHDLGSRTQLRLLPKT